MNDDYRISKFNIETDLPDGAFFGVIVGRSRSGKGVWTHRFLEKLIKAKKLNLTNAYLFSSSADVQTDSFPLIKHNRHTTYDDDMVMDLVEKNGDKIKAEIKKGKPKKQVLKDNHILFIIDDLVGNLKHSKSLIQLSTSGRHKSCSVLLLTQALSSAIPTIVRKNCSWLTAYPSISHRVMEILIKEYGLMTLAGFSYKESRNFLMNIWKSASFTAICILQHKVDVREMEQMIRYDRVIQDPTKTTKFLAKHTIDRKKKEVEEQNNNNSIYRRKNRYH